MANIEQVRDRLFSLGEPDFQKFSAALIPGEKRMIGVRLPHLRRLAREIAASGQWRNTFTLRLSNILKRSCCAG